MIRYQLLSKFINQLNLQSILDSNYVHVAGTNGKGSCIAYLEALCLSAGYTVNVFTSPHLIKENERIKINGVMITDEYLAELQQILSQVIEYIELTYFERMFLIFLLVQKFNQADLAIVEVGIGGLYDTTNIINHKILSIITHIDYDHQKLLGNTLAEIALQKAGIIAKFGYVVVDYQQDCVADVIRDYALKQKASVHFLAQDTYIDYNRKLLVWHDQVYHLNAILLGDYQLHNASVALIGFLYLCQRLNSSFLQANKILPIKSDWLEKAFKKVRHLGRIQRLTGKLYGVTVSEKFLQVYLDGAHNVSGAQGLLEFITKLIQSPKLLNTMLPVKIFIILHMLEDKDIASYLKVFKSLRNYIIFIPLALISTNTNKSPIDVDVLYNMLLQLKYNTLLIDDISTFLQQLDTNNNYNLVFITGSLYVVSRVLQDNMNNDTFY